MMSDPTDDSGPGKGRAPDAAAAVNPGEAGEDVAAELENLRKEAADSYDRYLRERAEAENFKKRLQREKVEAIRFATEPLVRDLLPVVDNLERALSHCGPADTAVREGLELVLRSLLDVLERHNVKRIESEGTGFDPTYHEAIAQTESQEHAPNAVTHQHQVGYLLNDRLLRPALVTVNARKAAPDAVESEQNSD
jgi:molecular chaperone GrpE